MGTITVKIVDHTTGEAHTLRRRVTAPHSLASHGRVRNNAVRALGLDGHHLTVTTRGSED